MHPPVQAPLPPTAIDAMARGLARLLSASADLTPLCLDPSAYADLSATGQPPGTHETPGERRSA